MKNKRKNIFEKTYHQCKIVIQYAQEIWMLLIYREQCKIKNVRYVEIKRTGLVMSCQSVLNVVYFFQQQKNMFPGFQLLHKILHA